MVVQEALGREEVFGGVADADEGGDHREGEERDCQEKRREEDGRVGRVAAEESAKTACGECRP